MNDDVREEIRDLKWRIIGLSIYLFISLGIICINVGDIKEKEENKMFNEIYELSQAHNCTVAIVLDDLVTVRVTSNVTLNEAVTSIPYYKEEDILEAVKGLFDKIYGG